MHRNGDALLAESDYASRFGGVLDNGTEVVATPDGVTARWTDRALSRTGGRTVEVTVPWATVLAAARRQIGLVALLKMLWSTKP